MSDREWSRSPSPLKMTSMQQIMAEEHQRELEAPTPGRQLSRAEKLEQKRKTAKGDALELPGFSMSAFGSLASASAVFPKVSATSPKQSPERQTNSPMRQAQESAKGKQSKKPKPKPVTTASKPPEQDTNTQGRKSLPKTAPAKVARQSTGKSTTTAASSRPSTRSNSPSSSSDSEDAPSDSHHDGANASQKVEKFARHQDKSDRRTSKANGKTASPAAVVASSPIASTSAETQEQAMESPLNVDSPQERTTPSEHSDPPPSATRGRKRVSNESETVSKGSGTTSKRQKMNTIQVASHTESQPRSAPRHHIESQDEDGLPSKRRQNKREDTVEEGGDGEPDAKRKRPTQKNHIGESSKAKKTQPKDRHKPSATTSQNVKKPAKEKPEEKTSKKRKIAQNSSKGKQRHIDGDDEDDAPPGFTDEEADQLPSAMTAGLLGCLDSVLGELNKATVDLESTKDRKFVKALLLSFKSSVLKRVKESRLGTSKTSLAKKKLLAGIRLREQQLQSVRAEQAEEEALFEASRAGKRITRRLHSYTMQLSTSAEFFDTKRKDLARLGVGATPDVFDFESAMRVFESLAAPQEPIKPHSGQSRASFDVDSRLKGTDFNERLDLWNVMFREKLEEAEREAEAMEEDSS